MAVFRAQDPAWTGDLDAWALTDCDRATLREFWTKLNNDQMEYCSRCRECWLGVQPAPLLPRELNTVLLRPANTSSHANLSRQFTRQFRVRRQAVMIWLDYLRHHHPGYRSIAIDDERLSQLPEDGNVVDAIPQSQVEAADVGPEEDQEAEPDLEDAAAVPDLLAKDTELDALRSILAARARSKFFVKQHDGTREPLTREQLIQALEHAEDPRAQALINSITRKRQDLEAYAYSLGCPGAFITFSPADLHWRSLYQHMPRYEEWLGASEPERMALSRTKFNVTDYWGRDDIPAALANRQPLPAPQMQYRVLLAGPKEKWGPGERYAGAAADIEAANVADPERECRFNFPRALRELAAVIRKEGKSYYIFEAAHNDSLMNHFNPAIILGWLANIDISPCTSLQAVITYAAKYCSKSEKKTEPYCKLADQEGTRMVVYVDCRPLEQHVRSFRVDEDSYNLKTWRRLGANAKKRLMMAHPHRSPEELLAVDGQPFESFAAAYQCCRQRHHFHEDDHYGEVGANELQAEDDEFQREEHEEPVVEEDWHELARMLPDHPLEEEDIDVLGRRDVDGDFWKQRKAENPLHLDVDHQPLEARDSLNPEQRLVYDTVMGHFLTQACSQLLLHVDGGGGTGKSYLINLLSAHLQAASGGRGTPVWRAAPTGVAGNQISGTTLHSLLHLPINKDFKPLSAIDKAQLQKKLKDVKYLIVDEKSMLEIKGRNAYRRFDKTVFLKVAQRQRGDDQAAFRSALEELRLLQLSMESWKLLSSRVQAKLDDQEVAKFVNSLRVYATKDRVMAKNVGPGAAAAPDDKPVGLCNGARDPPCVIMMEFDKYRDFLVGATLCTRTQFPLIVCYAITVHKSQSITEDMIVTDLSCRDFQTGLSYVAVSRVKTLQGLMLDARLTAIT
ncbi:PIF1-like helicase [Hirsutella rhossiliensis]|uniref:ATP-dependent DNA helicase n=1 Tax=Hirsutella rhossiliensis TaxID=111463 RepID=A0A9P8MNB7_9HYPO|nr:PIF1-like helicase domain-containing protein [Hirsutella rhossiliensis]KAH0959368.1 PIF1-like helicase domain-containing protein [Hirsutella rhossiliensis]